MMHDGFAAQMTLYHRSIRGKNAVWRRVHLHGISWHAAQVGQSGLRGHTAGGRFAVRVPAAALAPGYLNAAAFAAAGSPDGAWSVCCGDVAVKGFVADDVADDDDAAALTARYPESFTVTEVGENLRGAPGLWHLRLQGA